MIRVRPADPRDDVGGAAWQQRRQSRMLVVFDPVEFLGRLAVLVPRPRVNLILYYGVLGARAAWRSEVVPRLTSGSGGRRSRGRRRLRRRAVHRAAPGAWPAVVRSDAAHLRL